MIKSARRKFGLLFVALTGGATTANTDPKKDRVTENPSAGSYTIQQEIQPQKLPLGDAKPLCPKYGRKSRDAKTRDGLK
jgi:hypothetical protein